MPSSLSVFLDLPDYSSVFRTLSFLLEASVSVLLSHLQVFLLLYAKGMGL